MDGNYVSIAVTAMLTEIYYRLAGFYYLVTEYLSAKLYVFQHNTLATRFATVGKAISSLASPRMKKIVYYADALRFHLHVAPAPYSSILIDFYGSQDEVFISTFNHYNKTYATAPNTLRTDIIKFISRPDYSIGQSALVMKDIIARMDEYGFK